MTTAPNAFESEIDCKLSELWQARAALVQRRESLYAQFANMLRIPREQRENIFPAELVSRLTDLADAAPYGATAALAKLDETNEALRVNKAEAAPLEKIADEKGWSRFFLVNNKGGHIHRDMNCSTCTWSTSFSWLPMLSGLTERDAVEAHGSILCTVCYPSAPVEYTLGVSKVEEAEKAARAAAKAERDAEKAEKGITNPDGSPLEHRYGQIKTLISAQRELTSALVELEVWKRNDGHPNQAIYVTEYTDLVNRIAAAIAFKTGADETALLAEATAKALKKYEKERA